MQKICFFLFSLMSLIANAQEKKGVSVYQKYTFDIDIAKKQIKTTAKIGDESWSLASSNKSFLYFDLASEKIQKSKSSPFIAVSCRWEDASYSKTNTIISIAYSENNIIWTPQFILTPDEHFISNNGTFVSELQYINTNFNFYKITIYTNNDNKHKSITSLFTNLFDPAKTFNDNKDKTPTNYLNNIDNLNAERETNTTITDSLLRPSACPCSLPSYITRTQWNCPQGQGLAPGVGTTPTVTHLVMHHSAGNNISTDWNAVVLSIWNFHTGTNGYSDIGYNWLVAPNGQLYEGRGSNNLNQNVTGAHFCGYNAAIMGTCMLGTYNTTDITTAARNTLVKTLAWKCCQANIPTSGTALHVSSNLLLNRICGHRDGCATECPGTLFYNTLPALRISVQASIDTCGSATPPPSCIPSLKIRAAGCPNNSITFTPINLQNEGTMPVYAWYVNNVLTTTGNTFTFNTATNIDKVYARMTSNAACATPNIVNSDTLTLSCIIPTPIITPVGVDYCYISPNPNNGKFAVNMNLTASTLVSYKLSNSQGKLIFSTDPTRLIGTISKQFNQTILASGTYFLEVFFNNKKVVYKVIIRK